MNDTPETDKATIASGGDWCPVLRETCRRLERERDNEMKWHHQTHQELVETQCKVMDITQERDEARAAIPDGEWVAYEDHKKVHDAASRLLVAINKQLPIGSFSLISHEYHALKDAIYGKEGAK